MTYQLSRHLQARSVGNPTFAPGDERLYFTTDVTGEMELWSVSEPGAWPTQETFFESSVRTSEWCPDGRHLAVSVAPDGARRQLYALDTETGRRIQLTDDPETIHNWGGWRNDGKRYAFTANRSRPDAYDVYTREFPSGEERLVHRGEPSRLLSPVEWGPRGERLLLREMHSNFDHDLYLLSLDAGELTRLTDGQGTEARYESINWHPDGDALFLVTDYDYEWRYLARLDVETESLDALSKRGSNLKDLDVNWSSETLAYRTRRDGFSEVVTAELVGPAEIETLATVDVPPGDARTAAISRTGEQVAVAHVPVSDKPDVFVGDVETGETTRWTDVSNPAPLDEYRVPERVSYESHDGLEIPSFLTTPADAESDPAPAVVHLHAGPRQKNSPACDPVRQALVERGYARFEPEYRGSAGQGREFMALDDGARRVDAVGDVAAAADWLAEHPAVDGERVLLYGRSYGGFLAMAAMIRYPDRFAGGVAAAPVTDFVTYLEGLSPWKRENREAEYGSLQQDREFLEELSPVNGLDEIESPLLVVHGAEDRTVSPEQTKLVAEAIGESDPIRVEVIEGADHLFRPRDARIEFFERMVTFFDGVVSDTAR